LLSILILGFWTVNTDDCGSCDGDCGGGKDGDGGDDGSDGNFCAGGEGSDGTDLDPGGRTGLYCKALGGEGEGLGGNRGNLIEIDYTQPPKKIKKEKKLL